MTWKHLRDETRTARKPHLCWLCGKTIGQGVQHVYRCAVEDGEFVSIRMHVPCEESSQGWDEMDWETFSPGELEI